MSAMASPSAASMISWLSSPDEGFERAGSEGKLALLEFSRAPRCAGSVRLVAEIYPQEKIFTFICRHFVPVRIQTIEHPQYDGRFNVVWWPTLIIAEPDGAERHRVVGFLPADDLLVQLDLGVAKAAFGRNEFERAQRAFQDIVRAHPGSLAAPEADYWSGVSEYKHTHDRAALKATGERLRDEYPNTEWAIKGSVWLA